MKMKVRSGSPKGKASSSKVNAYFAARHLHDISSAQIQAKKYDTDKWTERKEKNKGSGRWLGGGLGG